MTEGSPVGWIGWQDYHGRKSPFSPTLCPRVFVAIDFFRLNGYMRNMRPVRIITSRNE
jgi:hypothetical protein